MKVVVTRWLIGFVLFTVVGTVFGLQFYFTASQQGATSPAGLHILDQLCSWYTWGALFPFLIWIVLKLPLDPEHRIRNLVLLVFIGIGISYVHAITYASAYNFLDQWYSGEPFSYDPVIQGFLRLNIPMRVVICYLLFAGIYAADFYKKYHERTIKAAKLEQELAVAKVQMMKMQLHPHFLFNTLHTIAGLVRNGDKQQAVTMIAGLSDLLRTAMDRRNEQTVPLAQEIEFAQRYLAIEHVRFSDRLTVKIKVDPDTLGALVPNLLLQPLIENAIIHGISPRSDQGIINLSACRENGLLHIIVEDNGVGLPTGWDIEKNGGIGLTNTRKRLTHLYGNNHVLRLSSGKDGGTSVIIQLPYASGSETEKLKL